MNEDLEIFCTLGVFVSAVLILSVLFLIELQIHDLISTQKHMDHTLTNISYYLYMKGNK